MPEALECRSGWDTETESVACNTEYNLLGWETSLSPSSNGTDLLREHTHRLVVRESPTAVLQHLSKGNNVRGRRPRRVHEGFDGCCGAQSDVGGEGCRTEFLEGQEVRCVTGCDNVTFETSMVRTHPAAEDKGSECLMRRKAWSKSMPLKSGRAESSACLVSKQCEKQT